LPAKISFSQKKFEAGNAYIFKYYFKILNPNSVEIAWWKNWWSRYTFLKLCGIISCHNFYDQTRIQEPIFL